MFAAMPGIWLSRSLNRRGPGSSASTTSSVHRSPTRAAYQLTTEGAELAGALRLLAHWGTRHTDRADTPRHPTCGTPIEARWYCPTCDQLVDDEPSHPQVHYV